MKKFFSFAIVAIAALAIVSCADNKKAPSQVVEEACAALKEGNTDKFMEYVYFEGDSTKVNSDKQKYKSALDKQLSPNMNDSVKIEKFEKLGDEMINEDKTSAQVKMKFTMTNGNTKEQEFKLVKDKEENWKLESGK